MVKYLLGQLAEQDEADLESRYLADDGLFEELLAIEADLRDAYVRDELSEVDREAFEQRLLSAPRQNIRQDFARALQEYQVRSGIPARGTPQVMPGWKLLFQVLKAHSLRILIPAVSAALALLVVGSWWLGRRSTQPPQSRNAPGVVARSAGQQPNKAPQVEAQTSPEAQVPEAKTFAIVFSGGLVRSSGQLSNDVVIPTDVNQVQLEARFEGNYPSYQAVLQTAEGKSIWGEGNLTAQTFRGGKRIQLKLSSGLLLPADYILTLRGLPPTGAPETVAEYAFRVRSK